jgi:hypothetical protein
MFEILSAAYPEKFTDDSDATWDAVQQFAEEIEGFDAVADLIGRLVMLSMPMKCGLTERWSHCLGSITFEGSAAHMTAGVRRDALTPPTEEQK